MGFFFVWVSEERTLHGGAEKKGRGTPYYCRTAALKCYNFIYLCYFLFYENKMWEDLCGTEEIAISR